MQPKPQISQNGRRILSIELPPVAKLANDDVKRISAQEAKLALGVWPADGMPKPQCLRKAPPVFRQ